MHVHIHTLCFSIKIQNKALIIFIQVFRHAKPHCYTTNPLWLWAYHILQTHCSLAQGPPHCVIISTLVCSQTSLHLIDLNFEFIWKHICQKYYCHNRGLRVMSQKKKKDCKWNQDGKLKFVHFMQERLLLASCACKQLHYRATITRFQQHKNIKTSSEFD